MFKRNKELVERVENILTNGNLNENEKKDIQTLLTGYKDNTYGEWGERHDFYGNVVSDMVNDMGFDEVRLATKMANDHPTLQQTFMRLCAKFIHIMSGKSYYDCRNEVAVKYAKSVMDNVGEEYFPFV